jgi:hypothetical protein
MMGMPMMGAPMPKKPEVDTELDRVVEAPPMVQRGARRTVFVRRPTVIAASRPGAAET